LTESLDQLLSTFDPNNSPAAAKMDENMQQTSNLLQHFHSNEHNLEELKDSLKEKIASIDNS